MKLTIYEQREPEESALCLRLEKCRSDPREIMLVACDPETGETLSRGRILTISLKGIHLFSSVHEDFGLPLNRSGRVEEC